MNFFGQVPLFRIAVPFITGILTAIFCPIEFKYWWCIPTLFAFITIGTGLYKPLFLNYKNRWVYGVVLCLTLFFLGFFITIGNIDIHSSSHLRNFTGQKSIYKVRVAEPPTEKENFYKLLLSVDQAIDSCKTQAVKGNLLAYFQKDSLVQKIKYGDVLLLSTTVNSISPPLNPGEFNYKRYLELHQIYHQAYISSESWTSTEINEGNILFNFAYLLRTKLLHVFTDNGITDQEFGVASALILGFKGALDKELLQSYSVAGATHVLAVSGLHVGIIFIIMNHLLFFMDRYRSGRMVKALLLIIFLWFYAILTGLSPSVLRAATMFSFIVIGKATNRYTNIYNTLLASALFLLMFNPFLIMEVGFQLSYLAVIGIVYIQPKIYEWYRTDNWFVDKVWSLTAVSFAAQLATFPLGLFYFHQFPNYFFISNLIVIPLASFIVHTGILLFVVSIWELLAISVGKVLHFLIWTMNYAINLIESMPYSLTEGISIDALETCLIYLIIITALTFIALRKTRFLYLNLGISLVFVCYQLFNEFKANTQQKLVVYSTPKTLTLEFISGINSTLYSSQKLLDDESTINFLIRPNWLKTGISKNQFFTFEDEDCGTSFVRRYEQNYFEFHENKLAVVRDINTEYSTPLCVDYLILSNIHYLNWDLLLRNYSFDQLIVDSTHPKWQAEKWKKEAGERGLLCHAIPVDGAFINNF